MAGNAVPSRRSERIWMAGVWLFFAAWFLGANLWKAPGYGTMYEGLGLTPPTATRALLAVSDFCRQFAVPIVLALLAPLVPILAGKLDGKAGKFTVVMILVTMATITLYTMLLFIPVQALEQLPKR